MYLAILLNLVFLLIGTNSFAVTVTTYTQNPDGTFKKVIDEIPFSDILAESARQKEIIRDGQDHKIVVANRIKNQIDVQKDEDNKVLEAQTLVAVIDNAIATAPNKCGNAVCDPGETCSQDCIICGDHNCVQGEDDISCPQDCPSAVCGDGNCYSSENDQTCPIDCQVIP